MSIDTYDALDILLEIERQIDNRIQMSSIKTNQLKRVSLFTEDVLYEAEFKSFDNGDHLKATELSPDMNACLSSSETNTLRAENKDDVLEEILKKAREMRVSKSVEKKSVTSKKPFKSTESMSNLKKSDIPVVDKTERIDKPIPTPTKTSLADILHFIVKEFEKSIESIKNPVPLSLESEIFTRQCELYFLSQSSFVYPPSSLFESVKSVSANGAFKSEGIENLATRVIGEERQGYDRISKPRVTRLKFNELDKKDYVEIFRLWYKLRRLHEVIAVSETQQVKGKKDKDIDDLKKELLGYSPTLMATHTERQNLTNLNSTLQKYSSNKTQRELTLLVSSQAAALESRTKYLTELIISKKHVQNTISNIKECCKSQQISKPEPPKGSQTESNGRPDWTAVLSTYRDLYTLLVRENRDFQGCQFFDK